MKAGKGFKIFLYALSCLFIISTFVRLVDPYGEKGMRVFFWVIGGFCLLAMGLTIFHNTADKGQAKGAKAVFIIFLSIAVLATIGDIGRRYEEPTMWEDCDNSYTEESLPPEEPVIQAEYSEAYVGSSYYAALCQVPLTGNYREDVINIALSQVGYHEGDSEADFGGSSSGSGDYTEYGNFLESAGSAWCSEFASWCIRKAGVPTSVISSYRAANVAGFTAFTSADFYTMDVTAFGYGSYMPQKGDLLLWSWDGVMHGTEENLSHTSILLDAQDLGNGNVLLTSIDGNSNDQVQIREYEVSAADGSLIGRTGMLCYIIAPHYEE